MSEILLTHYGNKGIPLCKSISSGAGDTSEIVRKLSQLEGKAYHRFRNYEWYALQRKETEQWLYKCFVEIGGIPKMAHPIYFIVGESEYIKSCYGPAVQVTQLKLDEISEKECSFTLLDSMAIHVSGGEKQVFSREGLIKFIESKGTMLPAYIAALEKAHQYIEAQLWSNNYFSD